MSSDITPRAPDKTARENEELPAIGSWHWVKTRWKDEDPCEEMLMCVEHVASNHTQFSFYAEDGHGESTERISHDEFLSRTRPAPEWRGVIEQRMEATRLTMQEATKKLYDQAVKKGALTDEAAHAPADMAKACMLPAVRVMDPAKQKRDLVALEKYLPIVSKKLDELAKTYAGHAKALMMPELHQLEALKTKLGVVKDKIFTLEVYAGLQEEVHQIATGEPARPDAKVTVRQTMLYMDEETLVDYDDGGLDFSKLKAFDAWVVRPENLNRILPEPRGIVAFRIRRNTKDYGPVESLWEAWCNMEKNHYNMETYLLIRNGDNVYRICSAVSFEPRLIPLRNEFDDAFKNKRHGWMGEPDTFEIIGPQDFRYDDHRDKLLDRLKGYNRIVILIQGLLDRSEVFHPHLPINLASEDAIEEWLNFVRDEEDNLATPRETWSQYKDRLSALIVSGSLIYSRYDDGRRRPWDANRRPNIIAVKRVRKGNLRDVVPQRWSGGKCEEAGRSAKACVDIPGVEVEWAEGKRTGWEFPDRWHGSRGKWGDWPSARKFHMWIPLPRVFNVSAYRTGDYKQFALHRDAKRAYLEWAPTLFAAEDYHLGRYVEKNKQSKRDDDE